MMNIRRTFIHIINPMPNHQAARDNAQPSRASNDRGPGLNLHRSGRNPNTILNIKTRLGRQVFILGSYFLYRLPRTNDALINRLYDSIDIRRNQRTKSKPRKAIRNMRHANTASNGNQFSRRPGDIMNITCLFIHSHSPTCCKRWWNPECATRQYPCNVWKPTPEAPRHSYERRGELAR
ncbi:hypothetical protein SAMN04487857_104305 [Pseudomonas sp. ok272]|nr:hypothetical protein SAMN04487857_104305 [Pseudomonas sp. ok272]